MERLPNELLKVILQRLKDSSYPTVKNDLFSALLVCHRWNDVAMQVLWRDIYIESYAALLAFSTSLSAISIPLIQSFTILITPEGLPPGDNTQLHFEEQGAQDLFACDSTKEAWEALRTLSEKLPEMTNLRSFSLTICPAYSNERPWGFFMDSEVICTILGNLPPSTEDLELATGGMERPAVMGAASHLCSHLAIRLQHFKHVRLCLGMFCTQLFTQSSAAKTTTTATAALEETSKPRVLRTLVLDAESMRHPTLCYSRNDSSQALPATAQATTTKLSDLASAAQAAIEQGQYPKIESLTIHSAVGGDATHSMSFVVRDAIRGRTVLHPWDRANYTEFFLRCRDLSGCDHEYFGSPDALRAKAQEIAWRETADGLRFSSEYASSTHAHSRAYDYKDLGIYEGKEEYLKRSRLQPGFWYNEGKAGRWLLSPLVLEGFKVTRGPEYEKFVVQEDESSEGSENSDIANAGNDD